MKILANKSKEDLRRFNKHFERLIKDSDDTHTTYTPLELCDEIISKVHEENLFKSDTKVLILCNIEFIKVLQLLYNSLNINMDNVYFVTICSTKARLIEQLGANVIKYDSYKEFFEDNDLPKFDVVIGNPPYQAPGSFKGSSLLWHNFIEKANDISSYNAIISIIHPYTWLNGIKDKSRTSKKVIPLIKSGNLLELNLTPHKYFNVGSSTICYFIIQKNTKQKNKIKIIYDNIELLVDDLLDYDFIPGKITDNIEFKILEKTLFLNAPKFNIIGGGEHRKTKDNQQKTKTLKYSVAYTWSNFKKNKHLYSALPGRLQNKNKVIAFYSSNCEFIYDNGNFGLGEMTSGIEVNNETEGNNLINILNSKLYKFISKFKPYSGTHGGRPATLKHFPKLDLYKSWNDKDLYQHFNLTPEEIQYIDNNI